jgi:hypothetical protein
VRRHVSAEVIALLREGEVSARKAGRITAHLLVCADCAGIDSDLAAVPAMLAAVQLPPMPDTITERLQLAIASEATARTAASSASGAVPAVSLTDAGASSLAATAADVDSSADSGAGAGAGAGAAAGTDVEEPGLTPGRPDQPERARGRSWRFRMPGWSSPLVLRGLAAAGAVVVIAGAGLLLVHGQIGQENSASSGSGGAAAGPRHPAPSPGVTGAGLSHGRYSALNGPMSLNYRLKGKIATARALTSHHNYTKLNLAPLVHRDVASTTSIEKGVAGTSRPPSPSTFGGIRVPTLIGCLTKIAAGRSVLVADIARYLGRPATIVVLRPSAGSQVLDVVVVGLTCSSAAPDIIAELTVPAG